MANLPTVSEQRFPLDPIVEVELADRTVQKAGGDEDATMFNPDVAPMPPKPADDTLFAENPPVFEPVGLFGNE